jgi:hypothetical protein
MFFFGEHMRRTRLYSLNSGVTRSKTSEKAGRTRLSGLAPDYLVCHKGRRIQRSTALNPNGRLTWQAPDNEQCHVRCTRRQKAAAFCPMAIIVVGAINTPQPPPFSRPKHSMHQHSIQEQEIHSKIHSKLSIFSKCHN